MLTEHTIVEPVAEHTSVVPVPAGAMNTVFEREDTASSIEPFPVRYYMKRSTKNVLAGIALVALWGFAAFVFTQGYADAKNTVKFESMESEIGRLGHDPVALELREHEGEVYAVWANQNLNRGCVAPVQWEHTRAILGTVQCE